MTDHEEASELLDIVSSELRALRGMSDAEVFTDELFGFVVQQATEKSLKAWLSALGQVYPLTHNLSALVEQLQECGQAASEFEDLTEWTPFGVRLRYSRSSVAAIPLDRADAIARVQALYDQVSQIVEAAGQETAS